MADDSGEIVREAAESAAFANVKTLGEATAFYTAQAMASSNAAQHNAMTLGNVLTGKIGEMIIESSASESKGADVNALLTMVKALQSVQPVPSTQT